MLHPQARALLDLIEQRGIPPTHTLSAADARAFFRERRNVTQPPPPAIGHVQDLQANGPDGPIPLRDEGAEYAQRLTAAGNQASYVHFARQIHGFVTMGKVIDEANTAVALCAAELRRVLNPRSVSSESAAHP